MFRSHRPDGLMAHQMELNRNQDSSQLNAPLGTLDPRTPPQHGVNNHVHSATEALLNPNKRRRLSDPLSTLNPHARHRHDAMNHARLAPTAHH